MFDLVITPITNKFQAMMELYTLLKDELKPYDANSITIINNGSTDGLSERSFHTHDSIHYIGSKHKTKDLILLNHALMRLNPEFTENQWILMIQPNTEIPENFFKLVESAIQSNLDADVILGRVDHKVKNQVKIDPRIKLYERFTTERNSGQLLKNFPPVPEKAQKTSKKQRKPLIYAAKAKEKTETEIGEQSISARASSRLEEPQDAQLIQGLESIQKKNPEVNEKVTKNDTDKKCHAIFSDKICQCGKCVEKDTIKNFNIKKVNGDKKCLLTEIKKFNIKKVNSDAECQLVTKSVSSARREQVEKISGEIGNVFNISCQGVKKFYSPNNILLKKDAIFKMGLFDIDFNFNQSMEILIHKMINLQCSTVVYCDDFPVTSTGKVRKHRQNKEMLDKVANFDFVYKDYIDKNVWRVYKGASEGVDIAVDGQERQAAAVSALVIVGSKQCEELIALTEKQLSFVDKLVVEELPDNCGRKLQEIIASNHVEQYSIVIIVNPRTKFVYSHFIDDFKKYACQMDWEGVLVSNRDFDIREITPGLAAEKDVSACFNSWNVFSPVVRDTSTLSEFLEKCSEQIDATGRGLVASFLPRPISRVPVMMSEKGEGGEVTKPTVTKHKSSWYDWMEE